MTNRNFDEWLNKFRPSISGYDYYIDFEKVVKNVDEIKVELNILNTLIGSKNIEDDFEKIVTKYPETLKCIPLLLAVRGNEIYAQDEDGAFLYDFKTMNYNVEQYKVFMRKTGLFDMITNHIVNNLVDYALGIETGLDSNGRKNRGGHQMEDLVEKYIVAAGGKEVKKKDLASIAMSYGYVYVAQIAMGADYNQCVKAIAEAEAYPGPSLVIAYAPCINHGIKVGMSKAQTEEKLAVEAGYWHTFRYNPALKAEGKAAFSLDSKAPTGDYKAFLNGEVRYNALARFNPERAEELFAKSEETAKERYEYLNKLITLYGGEN